VNAENFHEEVFMERLAVPPELIRWARKRTGVDSGLLAARWPKYVQWESGEASPTPRQLEELAHRMHMPLGFFYLPWAPSDELDIADFRPGDGQRAPLPSMALLETVHLCRLRQEWYRENAMARRMKPLKFIGRSQLSEPVVSVAESIRATVQLGHGGCDGPEDAEATLEAIIDEVEAAGILMMRGSPPRPLADGEVEQEPEFRGLALSDPHAPLIYLHGMDTAAAQIFTLAHELAHLWLGTSGISNPRETLVSDGRLIETFCNRVAAEALVPLSQFRDAWDMKADMERECGRLAGFFCVSKLIVLRRAYDAGFVEPETFHATYLKESERVEMASRLNGTAMKPLTPLQRVGRRFADALAASLQAHKITEEEAMGLLGAATRAEVWAVGGGHDACVYQDEEQRGGEAPCYAHLFQG
jgi:Zn-dependent peptidase ImmA (M78 family)